MFFQKCVIMRQLYTTKRKSLTVTYSTSATVCSDILHNASFMMWCWYVGSKTTSVSLKLFVVFTVYESSLSNELPAIIALENPESYPQLRRQSNFYTVYAPIPLI